MGTSALGRFDQRRAPTGSGSEEGGFDLDHDDARSGEHYLPALTERALRERVDKLQVRIVELEQSLVCERTGRVRAARDLERLCQQLSTLAHELRNPLSSISGWLQLICAGKIERETRWRALASMTRSLRTLTRSVEDFADFARCVEGSLTLHRVAVSPAILLAHALGECRPLAIQRCVSLHCETAPRLPELQADPCRLRQIFELLISSVLRVTPRGGEVQVGLRPLGQLAGGALFLVGESDATRLDHPELGPLAPEYDGRRAQPPALSLQLARALIELHDGSLVNLGHAFEVELPATNALG